MNASSNPPPAPTRTRAPRLWPLSLATTGIVLALHLGTTLLWRGRLPDPVATHWGGSGVADGTGSLTTHVLLGAFTIVLIGILIPVSAGTVSGAGNRSGVPLLAGFGNGLVVGLGAMFISGLVGQLDAEQALGTRMEGWVLIGGLIMALCWGLASAYLVRAALPSRSLNPETAAPYAGAGATGVAPGTVISSTVRGPAWLLALIGVLTLAMPVLAFTAGRDNPAVFWSMVPGLVILVVAGVTCLAGRVVADEQGIRVYGGGFFKMLHVRPGDIAVAEGREITPAEFGGWGLRVSGVGVAFIIGTGPGVIVNRTRGGSRIYSVATTEDATVIAGLLNSLAINQGAGSST